MEKARQRAIDKKDRVGFGGRQSKLQLSEADQKAFADRGRVVRWFNDNHGRIEAALQAGYTFVAPEEAKSVGSMMLHEENSDLNDRVSKVVSRGEPVIRAYLMSVSKDWYDEDQAKKAKINDQVDEALRPAEQGGHTIDGGYTPK